MKWSFLLALPALSLPAIFMGWQLVTPRSAERLPG
jgi:hypothetical protein